MEAIRAGKQFDKLFIQKGLKGELIQEFRELCQEENIFLLSVPIEKLNRITRKNHQGVIGFISPVEFHQIEHLIPQIYESGKTPLILILDRVTDVRNFGAIIRTAECAGVNGIVIPVKGAAALNADAVKTSAGAAFNVPICKVSSLKRATQLMKDSGIQTIACTEKTNTSLYQIDYQQPSAIIMGNEEKGIDSELLSIADHHAKIPLNGEIGSLNVSVAAGVILYESVRQRLSL